MGTYLGLVFGKFYKCIQNCRDRTINSLCPIQVPHIRIFGRRTQLAVGQHKTWEYVITFPYPRLLNLVSAHARMLRLAFSPRARAAGRLVVHYENWPSGRGRSSVRVRRTIIAICNKSSRVQPFEEQRARESGIMDGRMASCCNCNAPLYESQESWTEALL